MTRLPERASTRYAPRCSSTPGRSMMRRPRHRGFVLRRGATCSCSARDRRHGADDDADDDAKRRSLALDSGTRIASVEADTIRYVADVRDGLATEESKLVRRRRGWDGDAAAGGGGPSPPWLQGALRARATSMAGRLSSATRIATSPPPSSPAAAGAQLGGTRRTPDSRPSSGTPEPRRRFSATSAMAPRTPGPCITAATAEAERTTAIGSSGWSPALSAAASRRTRAEPTETSATAATASALIASLRLRQPRRPPRPRWSRWRAPTPCAWTPGRRARPVTSSSRDAARRPRVVDQISHRVHHERLRFTASPSSGVNRRMSAETILRPAVATTSSWPSPSATAPTGSTRDTSIDASRPTGASLTATGGASGPGLLASAAGLLDHPATSSCSGVGAGQASAAGGHAIRVPAGGDGTSRASRLG